MGGNRRITSTSLFTLFIVNLRHMRYFYWPTRPRFCFRGDATTKSNDGAATMFPSVLSQAPATAVLDSAGGTPYTRPNDASAEFDESLLRQSNIDVKGERVDERQADGSSNSSKDTKLFDPDALLELLWHAASRADDDDHAANTDASAKKSATGRTLDAELDCDTLLALARTSRNVLLKDPTLLELNDAPLKICGDIHGQFKDLLRIFAEAGKPPQHQYLFLGDYVDRTKNGLEVLGLLLSCKVKWPDRIFLLRGNHETASLNKVYGFYDECKRRASVKVWRAFIDVFDCLPIAATVCGRIFCCHGGLSPKMRSLDDIRQVKRPAEVPDEGLVCDLLWSDPSKDSSGWAASPRGVSFTFGYDVLASFLKHFDFDLLVRAHQVVEDGYEFQSNRSLVTVFSAPNYCGAFNNAAACLTVSSGLKCSFHVFAAAQPAKAKPERMRTWD